VSLWDLLRPTRPKPTRQMKADILVQCYNSESNCIEFYGAPSGQRIRVKQGTVMVVHVTDDVNGLEWGTTEDPVLKTKGNGADISVIAETAGTSKVFLLNAAWSAVFHVIIEVFDPERAKNMTITVGDPERK